MNKIDNLLVGTHNLAKYKFYKKTLISVCHKVLSLTDLNIREKPKETGATAEENAKIKAVFYMKKTGLPTFAEDEALYADFLPEKEQPGVNVRRIHGQE